MMNCVTIMGRLTSAPIPRGSGDRLAAAFSLAVQRDFKDKDGERGVDFVDCVAFGKLGEHVLGYFNKGNMMALRGRLFCGSDTDKDGQQRKSWQVIADDCYFCEKKANNAPSQLDESQFNEMYPFP